MSITQLRMLIEECIGKLVSSYLECPYAYYTESDLHCWLWSYFREALEHLDSGGPYATLGDETHSSRRSILLHREYPTKNRYHRPSLRKDVEKGSRGHFDLVIWDPAEVSKRLFRSVRPREIEMEQKTAIAVELALFEGTAPVDTALNHLLWDRLKLTDPKNEVRNGYLLFFTRDWKYLDDFKRPLQLCITDNISPYKTIRAEWREGVFLYWFELPTT